MSRRPSFEHDVTHSVRAPVPNARSFLDAYSYRRQIKKSDEDNNHKDDGDKRAYQ
jgi:hypothetical protein